MKTFNPTELNFSESAIEHFNNSLKKRGYGNGIQIGVRKAGCSGYEYFFDFVDEVDDDHILYEKSNCKIYVDKESLDYLKGTMVNFTHNGLNKGIQFDNPNAKAVCGCGESFTI
jgi:iron-sulfur cluster assembly protein|tara:strand:- start:7599 stop:7940 length:342 start_codon:yes stop_codon:yes gene_type:complete